MIVWNTINKRLVIVLNKMGNDMVNRYGLKWERAMSSHANTRGQR